MGNGQKNYHTLSGTTLNSRNGAPVVVVRTDTLNPDCTHGVEMSVSQTHQDPRIVLHCDNCGKSEPIPCTSTSAFANQLTEYGEIQFYCYYADKEDERFQKAVGSETLEPEHADLHLVRRLNRQQTELLKGAMAAVGTPAPQ